jgi:hypothetical protein
VLQGAAVQSRSFATNAVASRAPAPIHR